MNEIILHKPGKPSPVLIAIGLVVFAIGGTLLLGNLGVLHARPVIGELWPLGMIVIGIASLFQPSWRWSGFIWIVIGAFIYAKEHRWIDFSLWAVLPPVVMLVAGGGILYRALGGPIHRAAPPDDKNANYIVGSAIFSGTDLKPASQSFTGAELTAIMGGVKFDLTTADIPAEGAALDVFIVMGGMELIVPSDWAVKTDSTAIMAGFVDNRRPSTSVPTKTLTVRGFALLGGLEIRN